MLQFQSRRGGGELPWGHDRSLFYTPLLPYAHADCKLHLLTCVMSLEKRPGIRLLVTLMTPCRKVRKHQYSSLKCGGCVFTQTLQSSVCNNPLAPLPLTCALCWCRPACASSSLPLQHSTPLWW